MNKKLVFLFSMLFIGIALPVAVSAQYTGRWLIIPGPAPGEVIRCYEAYPGAVCDVYPDFSQNRQDSVYQEQQGQYDNERYRDRRRHRDDRDRRDYRDNRTYYPPQPVEQRRTVRHDYEIGFSPYYRVPYGTYRGSTETVTVTVQIRNPY